jgi:hypothetical protein
MHPGGAQVDTGVSQFAILIAVLTLAALVVLGIALSFGRSGTNPGTGVLRRLWNSLDLEFTDRGNWEANTTRTLRLLAMTMVIFGVVIVAWATAAGVMRTLWLYSAESKSGWSADKDLHGDIFAWRTFLVLTTEIVRAVGGMLTLCVAGGLAGAALGFLFGLPRPPRDSEKAPEAGAAAGAGSSRDEKHYWRLNSNLLDISDWLTKAIVGVSLFEGRGAATSFVALTNSAALWLFGSRHGSPAVIPAAIAGAAVTGFLFSYLYVQLIISGLVAEADLGLKKTWPRPAARVTLGGIKSIREGLVPRISRSKRVSEPFDQPTPEEVEAALEYIGIQFNDLKSQPGLTREDVQSWARAKAVLNDYREAAKGYIHLLGMKHNE